MSVTGDTLSETEINKINAEMHFTALPAFADFLLNSKLEEYTREQLRISKEINLPLLKYLTSFSEDELLAFGMANNKDFLENLSQNKILEYVEKSVRRWVNNQIPQLSRDALVLEDITMVSYMRRCVFRNMVSLYISDIRAATKILEEVDRFTVEIDTICLSRLVGMQQNLYKQAQQMTHIGNWVWDIKNNRLTWSDEMYRIYEKEIQGGIEIDKLRAYNHPFDLPLIDENIQFSLRTYEPHDFYYRIILSEGRQKTLHAKGAVKLNDSGEPYEMYGTVQDVTQQKETEKLVIEKQDLIEKIADLTPSIIAVYNVVTGKYIFINKGLQTLLGYDKEPVFEKGVDFFISLVHPDDLQALVEQNNAAVESANMLHVGDTEPIAEFKFRMRHSNGNWRWFLTYGTVFNRNANYKTEHILNITIDITEQYSLQKQLQEEKAFAELVTEMSMNRVIAFDRELRYLTWNKEAEMFYGKTKEEVLGKKAFDVFPQFADNHLMPYINRALAGEMVYLKEEKFFTSGWGEMYFVPLKKDRDEVIGVLCITHDITEIKRTNNELKELNLAFEHAEEIAEISHWQWNLNTNKLIYSDNQYRLLGCEPHSFEPTVENYLEFVHPDDHSAIISGGQEVLNDGKPNGALFRVIRKDGMLRYFHSTGRVFINEMGERILTGVNRDITDQHLLNIRLQQQNKELEQSNKELESFNYIASHDLQEPLRKIHFFTGLITERHRQDLNADVANYFKRISNAASRMQQLIEDLLAFSSIQNALRQYEIVQLHELVSDAVSILSVPIKESNTIIETGNLPAAKVIPFQFKQVLQNLIANAVKYQPAGNIPHIKITASKIKGSHMSFEGTISNQMYTQLTIEDNGIGFNQQYADKIFELFQRLHGKSDYPGTGIGLAICKKIVQNHNGFICVESEEGKGSKFHVFVPAV